MWWKLVLLTIYLAVLFVLSRILEVMTHYQGGYLPSRLLDPVSLSVQRLKALLDQRGVSYTGIVERHELTELVQQSGLYCRPTRFVGCLAMQSVFCSLAILSPRVGHTVDVLSPFISVLCHFD